MRDALAKFLNAWDRNPHVVSLGAQKNFARFMNRLTDADGQETRVSDVAAYRKMIAKAIIFKAAYKLVRPMFAAFQANITAYAVSLPSKNIGDRLDLDRVWQEQAISERLREQIQVWA